MPSLVENLRSKPAAADSKFISIGRHAQRVGVSYQKTQQGVEFWIEAGLLKEATGQQWNRIYVAHEILQIMSAPSLPVNAAPSPPSSAHD